MTKYVPLDALIAEIKNLEDVYKKIPTSNSYEEGLKEGRLIGYKDALHKIDTLEVKEVDIDKLCEFKKSVGFAYPECASEYQKQLACYRQGIEDVIEALKGEEV